MRDLDLDYARAALAKAHDLVVDLALNKSRWRMTIPADPERDSDLILATGLDQGEKAVAEVELLRRQRDALQTELAQLREIPELRVRP
jgi:hypothetical protein